MIALAMSGIGSEPPRRTRNSYNQQTVDQIVNMVVSGHIKPSYKDILPFASQIFGCEIKQTTAANWFSERDISLVDIKRKQRAQKAQMASATSSMQMQTSIPATAPQYYSTQSAYQHGSSSSSPHSYSNQYMVQAGQAYPPQSSNYTYTSHGSHSNHSHSIHFHYHHSAPSQYPHGSYPLQVPQTPMPVMSPISEPGPVNYYSYAPGIKRKPKSTADLGKTIITFVTSELMAKRVVTLESIISHLETLQTGSYSVETIKSTCKKYAITYNLPGVGPSGITYQQYLESVYHHFPQMRG